MNRSGAFGFLVAVAIVGMATSRAAHANPCYSDLSHTIQHMPKITYSGDDNPEATQFIRSFEAAIGQMQQSLRTPILQIIDAAGGPDPALKAIQRQNAAFQTFARDAKAVADDWARNGGTSAAQFQYAAALFGEYSTLVMNEYANAVKCHRDRAGVSHDIYAGQQDVLDQLRNNGDNSSGETQGGLRRETAEQRAGREAFDREARRVGQVNDQVWDAYHTQQEEQAARSQQNFDTFLNIVTGLARTYNQIQTIKRQNRQTATTRTTRSSSGGSTSSGRSAGGSNDCVGIPGQKTCGVE